jgi:hypothetical protein
MEVTSKNDISLRKKAFASFAVTPDKYELQLQEFYKLNPDAQIYKQVDSIQVSVNQVTDMQRGKLVVARQEYVLLHACIIYFTIPETANIQTTTT